MDALREYFSTFIQNSYLLDALCALVSMGVVSSLIRLVFGAFKHD